MNNRNFLNRMKDCSRNYKNYTKQMILHSKRKMQNQKMNQRVNNNHFKKRQQDNILPE
jgi:hypothetical protein